MSWLVAPPLKIGAESCTQNHVTINPILLRRSDRTSRPVAAKRTFYITRSVSLLFIFLVPRLMAIVGGYRRPKSQAVSGLGGARHSSRRR